MWVFAAAGRFKQDQLKIHCSAHVDHNEGTYHPVQQCGSFMFLVGLATLELYRWDTYDDMTVSYFSFLLTIWLLFLSFFFFFYFNWHNNCLWHKSDVATSFISSDLVVWIVEKKEAIRGSHDNVLKMEMRPGLCRGKTEENSPVPSTLLPEICDCIPQQRFCIRDSSWRRKCTCHWETSCQYAISEDMF